MISQTLLKILKFRNASVRMTSAIRLFGNPVLQAIIKYPNEIKQVSANKAVQESFADPVSFKFANITPAFKEGYRNFKDNYRPKKVI